MSKSNANSNIDYRAIVNSAAESILVTTAGSEPLGPQIVFANPRFEEMTGWSNAEVLGQSPKILQGPKTDHSIFADMWEQLGSTGLWEGRTINYRKDGSEFWMEWSIVPLNDDHGKVYQYLAVQRDVTDRVEADKRLRLAQKEASEADRARANLARYFSPDLVEMLTEKDQPLGDVTQQDLAVLFADIVGFTSLSEDLEPKQVMDLLREVHSWIEKAVFKWNGSIAGYVGDETLAIFGFPKAGEDDAVNALSCAFELLAASQQWNEGRANQGLLPVHIGIGVHYGPVVLGDVGTEDFVEFTVIGDTVNTASRLQHATRDLQCDLVASQDLVDAVNSENGNRDASDLVAKLQRHGEIDVRGRDQAVEVWTFPVEQG
ncbi:PAS domain S-box-containing protein [Shimia gijangensis]|uniref:PAS domain S-box-containing protein n=1 Tax=Shimia gijangensis TaxID=1470563 RepID=A0A1M6M920_9RHOB|nr:adenylate/guanylate cyclase domain-containing protein [Shimia gijangensis]SHJ79922.1 PAS domain S-box-containing protein [Shimia gijangensis]